MAYYRVYFFSPRSHGILRFEELEAQSDEEARSKAMAHEGEYALELWTGGRRVAQIETTDFASRRLAGRLERQQAGASAGTAQWA